MIQGIIPDEKLYHMIQGIIPDDISKVFIRVLRRYKCDYFIIILKFVFTFFVLNTFNG